MRLGGTRSSSSAFISAVDWARAEAASVDSMTSTTDNAASRRTILPQRWPCITFAPSNHDDVGIDFRCIKPLDVGLASGQRQPLVDVALVGDLVAVDRRRV